MIEETIVIYGAIMFMAGILMGFWLGLIAKWGERDRKGDEAAKVIRGLVDQNKTLREALVLVGQKSTTEQIQEPRHEQTS